MIGTHCPPEAKNPVSLYRGAMRKACLLLALSTLMLCSATPARGQSELRVFYAGPLDAVHNALSLVPGVSLVGDPEQAQVYLLNDAAPAIETIRARLQAGAGLVLFLGPQLSSQQVSALLSVPLSLQPQEQALSVVAAAGQADPLLQEIVWNSAPQVRQRAGIYASTSSLHPLVTGFEQPEIILASLAVGAGRAYLFSAYLDGANQPLQEWAYFNYLVYALVAQAAGQVPQSFAAYPNSPVPHASQRAALYFFLAGALLAAAAIFLFVQRYSRSHPELLETLVVDRQEFETRQAATEWEQIGFHRPLGGFMLAFMLGLVLFIPLIIYQNLILPVYILPSAQALGIWGRVTQFFNFLWLLLDMGTSAAFVKFFAQYRVKEPARAIQYGQVYIWWQALSGAVQVALVTAVAGTLLPQTAYALYTWSIIIHTLIQIPGFFQVMRFSLKAWQRFDYAQMVDLGYALVFPILAQPLIVTLLVVWGRRHPVFGAAMGGLLGLGFAAYATEALTFILGVWLYRRLGYNTRLLFLAHFDWATIKASFRFGVFEMIGSVAWALGQAMEVVVTQTSLVNYTEVWGNWILAQNFVFAFNVITTLYDNVMPSISEAISHSRAALSQYYAVMSYKWGGFISAFIGSVMLATADRFILGASGPEFVRAAAYAIPLIVWGAVQYPSWVSDNVQLGANRPYLKASLVAGEQTIRILLAYLLVARYQINALIIAYFAGLLAKDVIAYFINDRTCFRQRFFFWQSLGAPLLAGSAHFLLVRWVTGLVWRGDQVTSVLIFLIGLLFSYPFFAFFYGLFGGWDDPTLEELRQAADLSSFMRPLARLFWAASQLGARFSPLHGRFPITIRQAALDEAASLREERVAL
jgi:O-antigen/teichoic acid export membrane protein